MSNIFLYKDDEEIEDTRMDLDELYESKRIKDENKVKLYKKILNRVHRRIKDTSRQKSLGKAAEFCWFLLPEIVLGFPSFDSAHCTAYVIHNLRDNGFLVKYTHPNLLFISWAHWIPDHVRTEWKKQTGKTIDGYGNEVNKSEKGNNNDFILNPKVNADRLKERDGHKSKSEEKRIDPYKSTDIYNADFFQKLKKKMES